MIIAIIAYKEAKSVVLMIKKLRYLKSSIVLVAPDEETINVGQKFKVSVIRDRGIGKPAAINLFRDYLIKKNVNGDEVIVFIDGDVLLGDVTTIKKLVESAEKHGCAYGQPVYLCFKEPYRTWAKFLERVSIFSKKHGVLNLISGYLWAIKFKYLPKLPENLFAEDSYVTLYLINEGVNPKYVPEAKYYVLFPSNLKDYFKQRLRTFAGHWQVKIFFKKTTRGIKSEVKVGLYLLFKELVNGKLLSFVLNLLQGMLRVLIWIYSKKCINKRIKEVWIRVESTKL